MGYGTHLYQEKEEQLQRAHIFKEFKDAYGDTKKARYGVTTER